MRLESINSDAKKGFQQAWAAISTKSIRGIYGNTQSHIIAKNAIFAEKTWTSEIGNECTYHIHFARSETPMAGLRHPPKGRRLIIHQPSQCPPIGFVGYHHCCYPTFYALSILLWSTHRLYSHYFFLDQPGSVHDGAGFIFRWQTMSKMIDRVTDITNKLPQISGLRATGRGLVEPTDNPEPSREENRRLPLEQAMKEFGLSSGMIKAVADLFGGSDLLFQDRHRKWWVNLSFMAALFAPLGDWQEKYAGRKKPMKYRALLELLLLGNFLASEIHE